MPNIVTEHGWWCHVGMAIYVAIGFSTIVLFVLRAAVGRFR